MNQPFKKLMSAPTSTFRTLGKIGLVAAAFSGALVTASPVLADISVNVHLDAPPPPPQREVVVERERPGPDYVWVGGYWGGSPGHYTWVKGKWDRPPQGHPHGHWNAPHWEIHDGHYVQVRGEWRD